MEWWTTAICLIIVFLISGHNFTCTPSVEQMLGRTLRPHWRGETAFGLLLVIALVSLSRTISIPLEYHDWFFYAGMFWLVLAITWADEKMRSLRRTVQFGIAAFASLSLASSFDFDQRVAIVTTCSAAFLILELIDGAFQGLLVDTTTRRFGRIALPNRQAFNAFLVVLSLVYLIESQQISAIAGLGLIVMTLFLLMLTQSRAATWAGFLSLVVWLIASVMNETDQVSWLVLAMPLVYLVIVGAVFLILVPRHPTATRMETLVHLGRKPAEIKNLNQRKPLWSYTLQSARKRWVVGHGYGSFWTPSRSKNAAAWEPVNAHSLYLDVFASTGIIGLALLTGFFVSLVVVALDAPSPEMQFVAALTCFVTLVAGMESKFWLGDYDTFAFLVIALNLSPNTFSA